MSFLPLVQRELSVLSRKRATPWARLISAGVALAVALVVMSNDRMSLRLGQDLLRAITIGLLIEALLAGVRYTADCLSEEKREGTLGLLFLTNLSGFDVVAGKMAGRALAAFYNMIGVIPIYGLSILFGGVTGAQIFCLSTVLIVSMVFSLSVGMLISSRGVSERNVLIGTVLALLGVCFVPPILRQAVFWTTRSFSLDWLLHVSPVFAYTSAAAGNLVRTGYSAAILAGCSAAMLVLASWNIRSSFEAGEETRAPDRASDAVPRTAARRRNLLQMNPMFWLVMRQTHRGQMLWFGALAVLAGIVWRLVVESSGKGSRNMSIVILGSYGINVLFKFFLAVESSRRFSQDRRTGALELLLTTPLPVPFILRGQQLALRRSFFPAIAGVAGMFLFWMLDGEILREVFVMLPCSLLLLAYDAETIRWLGMLNGLRTQRLPAAIMRTMGQVVGFPAAIFALVMFTSRGMGKYEAQAFIFLWTLGCVVYNVILIRAAMHKLGHLRSLAAGDKWRPAWVAGGLPSGRAAMPN